MPKTWEEVTEDIAQLERQGIEKPTSNALSWQQGRKLVAEKERKDIYVIVSSYRGGKNDALIHEQEVNSAGLKDIRKRVQYLKKQHKHKQYILRIAKLVFIDEEE